MLIWTDLNILGSGSKENVVVVPQSKLNYLDLICSEIVDIINKMEEYKKTKKYVPTREYYREPNKKDMSGYYTEIV
jgi:hypothetical protein